MKKHFKVLQKSIVLTLDLGARESSLNITMKILKSDFKYFSALFKIDNSVQMFLHFLLTSLGMGATAPPIYTIALKIISHRFRVIKVYGLKILGT